jgi:hypothetical protein
MLAGDWICINLDGPILLSSAPLLDLTPELAFGDPSVGEWLPVYKNAGRKENPMTESKRFSFGRGQVKQGERKPVLSSQAFEYLFGLCAEIALVLREQKDIQVTLTFPEGRL